MMIKPTYIYEFISKSMEILRGALSVSNRIYKNNLLICFHQRTYPGKEGRRTLLQSVRMNGLLNKIHIFLLSLVGLAFFCSAKIMMM